MSNKTLTSLALLRVTIDAGGDYLHYLRPFVLHVLNRTTEPTVTAKAVANELLAEFGMAIPSSIVTIVLRRIAKRHKLRRIENSYKRTGRLPNPRLQPRQAQAQRHIQTILSDIQEYSQTTLYPLSSSDAAVKAICTFLSHFDITCIRMSLRRTVLPPIENPSDTDVVLVSDYVNHIHKTSPSRFDSFLVLVQGHMLANALTCPDLGNAPRTYKKTTFFLDTPIVIRLLGAEGTERQASSRQLVRLVRQLGGKFSVFTHTCDEIQHVLRNAVRSIDQPNARSPIVAAARHGRITKSDLVLISETVEQTLHANHVQIRQTPEYVDPYQIDEILLENRLKKRIPYFNPNAAKYDVNSVRSIFALRRNSHPRSIEAARAVFVTSNTSFASVAWEYSQEVEHSSDVSTVVTDFTLANTAWLKAPTGAPSVPTTQVLAFSYAALQPSEELLRKFLEEADRLEAEGRLTPHDHQILRSSQSLSDDVVQLTMGDPNAVTDSAVIAARDRALQEATKEQLEALDQERKEHQSTRDLLASERKRQNRMLRAVYWECHRRSEVTARASAIAAAVLLLSIEAVSIWQTIPESGNAKWWIVGAAALIDVLAILDFAFGTRLQKMHDDIQRRVLGYRLNKEARRLGIETEEFPEEDEDTEGNTVGDESPLRGWDDLSVR